MGYKFDLDIHIIEQDFVLFEKVNVQVCHELKNTRISFQKFSLLGLVVRELNKTFPGK